MGFVKLLKLIFFSVIFLHAPKILLDYVHARPGLSLIKGKLIDVDNMQNAWNSR